MDGDLAAHFPEQSEFIIAAFNPQQCPTTCRNWQTAHGQSVGHVRHGISRSHWVRYGVAGVYPGRVCGRVFGAGQRQTVTPCGPIVGTKPGTEMVLICGRWSKISRAGLTDPSIQNLREQAKRINNGIIPR